MNTHLQRPNEKKCTMGSVHTVSIYRQPRYDIQLLHLVHRPSALANYRYWDVEANAGNESHQAPCSFVRPPACLPACLPATLRTGTTCRSGRVRNGGKEQGTEVQCSVVPFAGNAALENIAHSYTNEFMFMGGSPFSE